MGYIHDARGIRRLLRHGYQDSVFADFLVAILIQLLQKIFIFLLVAVVSFSFFISNMIETISVSFSSESRKI